MQKCHDQGFDFTPLVFEAHGGSWSLATRRFLDKVAKSRQNLERNIDDNMSLTIAQRISSSLHRENARAVLRRAVDPAPAKAGSSWANYQEDAL